jgi:hypothetical protein
LRKVRARWADRKAARKQAGAASLALQAAVLAMLRAFRKLRARWADRKAIGKQ